MINLKYRPPEEMKDSGVEWVGSIPQGWGLIPNKYIAEINTGSRDTQDSVDDGKYPFYVRSKKVERIDSYSFDGEAILTPGDGDIGGIFHYVNGRFDFHQRVYKYSDFKNYHGKFLYYYLKVLLKRKVMGLSAKSTVDSLRMPMLLNFECVSNEVQEQHKIADFLDEKTGYFDSIISKKEKLIEKLEEAKKSLISEVVTGKVKIVNGQVVERKLEEMKDSGIEWLGMIPKDWKLMKIKNLAAINPPKSELPKCAMECTFMPMVKLRRGLIDTDEQKPIEEVYDGYTYFRENDIIMAKVTPCYENGNIAIAKGLKNGIGFGTTEINVFRAQAISTEFLYYRLQESHLMNYGVSHMTGVAGLQRVPTSYFSEFKFAVPGWREQKSIEAFLETTLSEMSSIQNNVRNQIDKLQQAKQSLIYEAVTGKIDLRDWETKQEGE